MLGHLIRKEILDHLLSLRFIILSAIGALIVWLSLYDGYAYYQARLRDYRLAQAASEDRIRQMMVADNWSEITSRDNLIHKSPTSMSIFMRGLEPSLGRSITVAVGLPARRLMQSPAAVEPVLGVFPPLDLGLVVQVVLSLFVLLLTYDAICGEKEEGTLRLIASFPVARDRLLMGKLIGALVPTLTAFGLPLLLGIGIVLMAPDVRLTGSELGRLGLVVVAFGLYLMAFICAGLFASCLVHQAATSFVLLLAFWAATVVVMPRLSLVAADSFRPAPSVHELQAEKTAIGIVEGGKRNNLQRQWEERYLKSSGKEPWKTPEGREAEYLYFAQTRLDSRANIKVQYDRLDEVFRNRYNARLDLAVILARFSPAFAFNNATVRLAGTGIDRQQRFIAAFDLYFSRNRDWADNTKNRDFLRMARPEKYGKYKWDVSDIPRFTYQETWPGEDVQAALIDMGVLALWGLIFFAGAYVTMLRYDLR